MKQKKILLLGGSAQQLVAIRAAKELGFYTVLCDYLPDNPGQHEVDIFYQVSTTDIDAVYKVAKSEQVDGILAYASDPASLSAAVVCERMHLPSNSVKSVEILGLKNSWREFLKNNGFSSPKSITFHPTIETDDLKNLVQNFTFPIVIKPTDSSGSKGVTVLENLNNVSAAIQWADTYSRNKVLIAEEYITRGFPHVIGGDIFIWDGKIVLHGDMACLRDLDNSPLIPIGKKYPDGLNKKQKERVYSELQRVVDILNIRFGEMNIEIILDKEDNVHFLELGPRAGGNMIPVQLSDIFNIDLVKANVQAAMGIEPDFLKSPIIAQNGCFMHYVLHSYQEGIFQEVCIDESIEPFVYRKVIYKAIGDSVEVFDGAGKAIGIIFLHFKTEEQMEHFCSNHNQLVKIKLKP